MTDEIRQHPLTTYGRWYDPFEGTGTAWHGSDGFTRLAVDRILPIEVGRSLGDWLTWAPPTENNDTQETRSSAP